MDSVLEVICSPSWICGSICRHSLFREMHEVRLAFITFSRSLTVPETLKSAWLWHWGYKQRFCLCPETSVLALGSWCRRAPLSCSSLQGELQDSPCTAFCLYNFSSFNGCGWLYWACRSASCVPQWYEGVI